MGSACSCAGDVQQPSLTPRVGEGEAPRSAAKYPVDRGSEEIIRADEEDIKPVEWVKAQQGGFDSPKPNRPSQIQIGNADGPPLPWECDGGDGAVVPSSSDGDGNPERRSVSPKGEGTEGADEKNLENIKNSSKASPEKPIGQAEIGEEDADELAEMLALLEQHRPLLKLLKGEDADEADDADVDSDVRDRASIIEELKSLSGLLSAQIKDIEKAEGQLRPKPKQNGMPSLDLQEEANLTTEEAEAASAVVEGIITKGQQDDSRGEAEKIIDGGFLTMAYYHDVYEEEILSTLGMQKHRCSTHQLPVSRWN